MGSASAGWLPFPSRNREPRVRLFCLTPAGGSATLFRPWLEMAPPELDIRPIQLPGRGARIAEPPFRRMLPLIDAFEAAVQPLLDRPFAVFGHSMGAWVAHAAVRRLRSTRRQRSALHLFVSANRSPPRSPAEAPRYGRSDADRLDLLRRLGGMPAELLAHQEVMAALLPTFAADLEILENHHLSGQSAVDCPITACAGLEDPMFRPQDLDGWSALTRTTFQRWDFAGGHFYLETASDTLLRKMADALL